jgi:hypothetical protein
MFYINLQRNLLWVFVSAQLFRRFPRNLIRLLQTFLRRFRRNLFRPFLQKLRRQRYQR